MKKQVNEAAAYRCYFLLKNGAERDLPITISTLGFNLGEARAACSLLRKDFPDMYVFFSSAQKRVMLIPKNR